MPDPISWTFSWPYFAIAFAAGYLLGSIPFGLLLTRLAGLGDLRKIGSGNIGATNVLRTGRKGLAAATLLLDGGKGAAAAAIAGSLYGPDMAVTAAAAAVIGHMFPLWLKFRGGKAVATALGVRLVLAWPVGLAARAGERLAASGLVRPLARQEDPRDVYHQYSVRLPADRRDAALEHLRSQSIFAAVHYPIPVHHQPVAAAWGYGPEAFPNALRLSTEILCLPIHPFLSDEQVDRVAEALLGALGA